MRVAAFRGESRVIGLGERQGRPVVDRRFAQGPRPGAAAVELVLCLIGAIESPRGDQRIARPVVERHAILLPHHQIRLDPEPSEVGMDALR